MSDTLEQLVARLSVAQKQLERLEAREMPSVRGWRDDFMGMAIHEQYAAVSDVLGVGSGGALLNNIHGGMYVLTAGAAVGAFHHLWLGNAADGFATLGAGYGWTMIARMNVGQLTNIAGDFGVNDSGFNNIIRAGLNTTVVAANWSLVTRTGGGAVNSVNSGVPANTSPHLHRLIAYPTDGGLRQVDYFLDGALIASTTVSVPAAVITPLVRCYAVAAAARAVGLDYWEIVPKNLA